MSTFLVIDFGEKRAGVASGSLETGLVSPLTTIQRTSDQQLISALMDHAASREATSFVVGLPRLLDGTESDSANRVRSFAGKLGETSGYPVHLVSETLTSREAAERIRQHSGSNSKKLRSKKSTSKRRVPAQQQLDAVAAQIIGEQFLSQLNTDQSLGATTQAVPSDQRTAPLDDGGECR